MEPLHPEKLEKLEYVLNNIWNGTLKHNQHHFFCGTSRCIAGWLVCLYSQPEIVTEENIKNYSDFNLMENRIFFHNKGYDAWDWSVNYLELTRTEACLLFCSYVTKPIHKLVLQAFKEGRRLSNTLEIDYKEYINYETLCPIVVDSEKAFNELNTFFNTVENVIIHDY